MNSRRLRDSRDFKPKIEISNNYCRLKEEEKKKCSMFFWFIKDRCSHIPKMLNTLIIVSNARFKRHYNQLTIRRQKCRLH